jgi:hypothetical protein
MEYSLHSLDAPSSVPGPTDEWDLASAIVLRFGLPCSREWLDSQFGIFIKSGNALGSLGRAQTKEPAQFPFNTSPKLISMWMASDGFMDFAEWLIARRDQCHAFGQQFQELRPLEVLLDRRRAAQLL